MNNNEFYSTNIYGNFKQINSNKPSDLSGSIIQAYNNTFDGDINFKSGINYVDISGHVYNIIKNGQLVVNRVALNVIDSFTDLSGDQLFLWCNNYTSNASICNQTYGNIYIGSNLSTLILKGLQTNVFSTLNAYGNLICYTGLSARQSSIIDNLIVNYKTQFNGPVSFISTISGNVTMNNNLTVKNDLSINNNIYCSNQIQSLEYEALFSGLFPGTTTNVYFFINSPSTQINRGQTGQTSTNYYGNIIYNDNTGYLGLVTYDGTIDFTNARIIGLNIPTSTTSSGDIILLQNQINTLSGLIINSGQVITANPIKNPNQIFLGYPKDLYEKYTDFVKFQLLTKKDKSIESYTTVSESVKTDTPFVLLFIQNP